MSSAKVTKAKFLDVTFKPRGDSGTFIATGLAKHPYPA